jgi:hypothetical protein
MGDSGERLIIKRTLGGTSGAHKHSGYEGGSEAEPRNPYPTSASH